MSLASRRQFLRNSMVAAAAVGTLNLSSSFSPFAFAANEEPRFKISLAEWSLHKTLFANKISNLDFPKVAKEEFGIDGVEYVNQFFKDKAKDTAYLTDLKKRSEDLGVANVLIMIDGEGKLGDPDSTKRKQAIENHYKWVDAAKFLGCHSIRVNAYAEGTFEEQTKLAAEGLRGVCEYAKPHNIGVIVENHGGLSSNGKWLAGVMKTVGMDNCGTLPDFGNFHDYDRYMGVEETMPFAKGVSAKSHDFDAEGNETHTDYAKMMKLVAASKYSGYIGIEYEGSKLDEYAGIRATKALLEKVLKTL
jgi:L-ribulose-5-phosphate 3-epimerase